MLSFCFDGFFWCPRMMTEPRRIEMREAPDGARWPEDLDPFALEVLAAAFHNRERNAYDPSRHCYGSLQPGRAYPCTHLDLLANLSAHEQRSDYGDAQLVYSSDSNTLGPEEKLARLYDFMERPPDVARVFDLCFRDLRPLLEQHATKLRNSTREDIEQLAEYFLARLSAERRVRTPTISPDALAALQAYGWPGNVRQLRNVIERTLIMAPTDGIGQIEQDHLPPEITAEPARLLPGEAARSIMSTPLREAREAFEREYLRVQVRRFSGNISRTAAFIGMERSALHRKLKALGIADESWAQDA